MSVRDERKNWDAFFASAHELCETSLAVGINDGSPIYADGTSLQEVAAIAEFGSPEKRIPPRPWNAVTFYDPVTRQGTETLTARIVEALIQGPETVKALRAEIGAYYTERMQTIVRTYPWAPNSAVTIRRKGSDQPLIDTGFFVSHIDWKIYDGVASET